MSDIHRDKADYLSKVAKFINEDIIWKVDRNGYRLKVRVLSLEIKEVLQLVGFIGRTNHSFTLLFQNLPIRRYCNQGRHTSPDGNSVTGPHKHTWDEIHQDGFVYVPNDIDPQADPNDQLLQFLTEQNITLKGNYQKVIV